MWFNKEKITLLKIDQYRRRLLNSSPSYVVIDDLFDNEKLDEIMGFLRQDNYWITQKHTYESLYVDNRQWDQTRSEERFVKRDSWQYSEQKNINNITQNCAKEFLIFLRSKKFMEFLSRIFNVELTDINVADPSINTNYFRLGRDDFVGVHADDSPGREVCMLIYLNKDWEVDAGGELVFSGKHKPVCITPLYNRCVLFDPTSEGSEHWVKKIESKDSRRYRYNITSWYWSK